MFGTIFSPCRTWRYTLFRQWGGMFVTEPRVCTFVCLNPSTADETNDDPTIRRCINYAKAWHYDAFIMTNIFAFRSTDPRDMKKASDPIGPENDKWLLECAAKSGVVVAGWGTHGEFKGRAKEVMKLIPNIKCLRITKDGHPSHPLYLPANLEPIDFNIS